MIKLSEEQRKVIESPEKKLVVIASPGSGKTLVLTERVRWVLKQGKDPSKMVCITFTNNAAEEMRQRLGGDYKDGMFIGTIHSYANLLLSRYGIDTRSLLDKENFDELFELMMSNPGAIQPIDFLALDEAQDSSLQQFEFIFDLLQPNSFIAVADPRQSIYQFAGGNPKLIINLANQYDVTMYELTNNFRSKDEIIAYSNWVLTKMKKQFGSIATGTRGDNGIVENIYGKEYITIIEYDKNYQDWAILCRTNNRVNSILTELKKRGIPAITFRQAQGSLEDLQDKMKENAVKVLTVHSCMTGDTLLITSKGFKTIKEIVDNKEKIQIYTGKEFEYPTYYIENEPEPIFLITTEYGSQIKLTANHDVYIVESGNIIKKKVKDLKEKDEVLLNKSNIFNKDKVVLKQNNKDDFDIRTEIWPTPKELIPELAELIGMYTADGTANHSSIHYHKQHKECCERFSELIKYCFNKETKIRKDPQKNMFTVECHSIYILSFLKNNFNGITSHNKFISDLILQSSKECQTAFLRGLFEDGTVHLKKEKFDYICLTYKNDKMQPQLQAMLWNLGIDPVFKKYKSQKYINSCYIYRTGAEIFKDEIGFITKEKQERLSLVEKERNIKNRTYQLSEIFRKYPRQYWLSNNIMSLYDWQNIMNARRGLTERKIKEFYVNMFENKINNDEINFCFKLMTENQIEQIKTVVPLSEEKTYCLTMPSGHFIQNGFVMGNSKGLEFPKVIVAEQFWKSEEDKRIVYVAATRAENELYWLKKGR